MRNTDGTVPITVPITVPTTVLIAPGLVARVLIVLLLALIAGAVSADVQTKETDPPADAVVTRPPQTLRVWLTEEPDVRKSKMTLRGPTGEMALQGLHTMGYEDLMVRIVGKVVDGEYTATWSVIDASGATHTGEWKFTVRRGG